jgi:hypothetical protein
MDMKQGSLVGSRSPRGGAAGGLYSRSLCFFAAFRGESADDLLLLVLPLLLVSLLLSVIFLVREDDDDEDDDDEFILTMVSFCFYVSHPS